MKLDFPLPVDVAEESREKGLLGIWSPRGYSDCAVPGRQGIAIDEAKRLLALRLEWEFRARRPL